MFSRECAAEDGNSEAGADREGVRLALRSVRGRHPTYVGLTRQDLGHAHGPRVRTGDDKSDEIQSKLKRRVDFKNKPTYNGKTDTVLQKT